MTGLAYFLLTSQKINFGTKTPSRIKIINKMPWKKRLSLKIPNKQQIYQKHFWFRYPKAAFLPPSKYFRIIHFSWINRSINLANPVLLSSNRQIIVFSIDSSIITLSIGEATSLLRLYTFEISVFAITGPSSDKVYSQKLFLDILARSKRELIWHK